MQHYYDVLGVSPTADDFVIKAAYKALAQRYHPDKFANNAKDAADAETKMRQLNEAYQILSDTAKRRDYDASLKQNQQQNSQQSSANSKQQADWQIALRFYSDLTTFETRLAKFDTNLVSEFRSNLLATQQYERRQAIADKLEQDYLEGYFGDHPDIVQFARELLLAGKREGAKELNQMLKVVGGSVPADEIIKRLQKQYFPHKTTQNAGFTQQPKEPEKPKTEWEKIQEQVSKEFALTEKFGSEKQPNPFKNEKTRQEAVAKMRESWGVKENSSSIFTINHIFAFLIAIILISLLLQL